VGQSDRHNLKDGVREGKLISDHGSERQATHKKDENKLERSQLFARTAAHNTNDEYEKEITKECSENGGHGEPW
jgi:hypothetical protein